MTNTVSLSAQHVVKRYGGVVALADGNLDIHPGEVVALLGANGSGKSTLGKIITGVVEPDEGQLLLNDQVVRFASPHIARQAGITAVYQELSLIPDMSVAENIWLTNEPRYSGIVLNKREMRARTKGLIDLFRGTVSAALSPDTPVNQLSPDERQIVEILKALSQQPKIVILDEATASLDSQQVERLFALVEDWKQQEMGVAIVSHRMDEIFRVADRATILRSGTSVGDRVISETTHDELVELMIEGASAPREFTTTPRDTDLPIRLHVKELNTKVLQDISFELYDGELLGIGGLQGQGQDDLLMALFGAIAYDGHILLSGAEGEFKHPKQAMDAGVAFVPGDRGSEGLALTRSILENLHLPSWSKYGVPLNMKEARAQASFISGSLNLVMSSLDAPVNSLSGGNAQKVVIGKWLLRNPTLLLLNDPTKGIDVGAKAEFYNLLDVLRKQGTAILFHSSDDEELLGLCDRVMVLQDGHIRAVLEGDTLNKTNLVTASMGSVNGHNQ